MIFLHVNWQCSSPLARHWVSSASHRSPVLWFRVPSIRPASQTSSFMCMLLTPLAYIDSSILMAMRSPLVSGGCSSPSL